MPSKRDYYQVLGVQREADAEEIKRAYRKLALQYHPDRNGGDEEASRLFKEVSQAYEVLGDPDKKQRYDRYGHAGLEGVQLHDFSNASSIFDLFGDIFGDLFSGGQRGPRGGRDIGIGLEIDLVEAARGCRKTVQVAREENCDDCGGNGSKRGSQPGKCKQCDGHGVVIRSQGFFRMQQSCRACGGRGAVITDPCPGCQGRGKVKVKRTIEINVPPGIDTGMQLALRGEGEAGEPGGQRGDLICELRLREHNLFKREGDHLICQIPITFSQAALGGDIEVPTLDGALKHNLRGGTQSGEAVRIAGKGIVNPRTGRPGDLLVVLLVETPRNLTKRQEELLRELAELDHKNVSPQRKSFFDKLRGFFTGSDTPAAETTKST